MSNPKTVVITGCSAGVGKAAALLLARKGWHVFAIVRKQTDADTLAAEASGSLTPLLADVGDRDQLFAAATEVASRCGETGLHGLICNAGVGVSGPLEFATREDLSIPVETNLYGSIFCAQAFLPPLRQAQGRIINLTSSSTLLTMPLAGIYPATKYALESFSRQLGAEVGPFGIRVIVVDPGHVKSRMTLTADERTRAGLAKLPPEALTRYGPQITKLQTLTAGMQGSGQEPEVVAETYLRALTDRKPKSLYTVGTTAKIFRHSSRWAPQRVLDWMVASMPKQNRG